MLHLPFWDGSQGVPRRSIRPLSSRPKTVRCARTLARGDGRHARLLKSLARVDLLILDDWGLTTLTQEQGRDILEIVEDRHNRGSTILTSQLPVDHWHDAIANPTIADAILDRLVHNAHRITLKGESMRKTAANRAGLDVKQDA
jgi:DNA replication protein DnaC